MTQSAAANSEQPHVVFGVTSGASAFSLLRGQLAWFREQGWRVTLVTTPGDLISQTVMREGVCLHEIVMTRRISPVADLRALAAWVGYLRRERPQAINASTPKAGLLGHVAGWVARVPRRVYIVRGLRVEGARGMIKAILWLMEWLTMRLATDVVFVSPSLAREAHRRHLIAPGKAWIIGAGSSNGVDAAAVARRCAEVDASVLRASMHIPASAFVVGFVGRVAPDKGVETLVQACESPAIDPRTHLLVVGNVEDESMTAALDRLGKRGHRTGWTDDAWGYLPAMDVLCLPTRREGFPNVVLESAAAGIPAIVTNATGAIDSVIDGETGFVISVGDDKALVERLNELASAPDRAHELGMAAKARVERDFAPERIWDGVLSITEGRGATADVRRV